MESVGLIVIGILLLGGLGSLFLAKDVWRWYHITIVTFLLIAVTAFIYLSARTMQANITYRTEVERLESQIETAQKKQEELVRGTETPEPTPGLRDLQTQLDLALTSRGRVWRGGQARVDRATGASTVTFQDIDLSGLTPNTVVHVFEEAPRQENGQYLGEFIVRATTNQEVDLLPLLPMDQRQLERLGATRSTWVLYEVMPPDTHELFAGLSDQVKEQVIRDMFPAESHEEFLRDMTPAQEGDPEDRIWYRLEFTQQTEVQVEADLPTAAQLDAPPPRETQTVTFEPGQTTLLPKEVAQTHIDSGAAKKLEEVYVRPLRSYGYLFRTMQARLQAQRDSIATLNSQIEGINKAVAQVKEGIKYREGEIEQLKVDLQKFNLERDAIAGVVKQIDQRYEEVRTELSRLYRENLSLVTQLQALQKKLIEAAPPVDQQGQLTSNLP